LSWPEKDRPQIGRAKAARSAAVAGSTGAKHRFVTVLRDGCEAGARAGCAFVGPAVTSSKREIDSARLHPVTPAALWRQSRKLCYQQPAHRLPAMAASQDLDGEARLDRTVTPLSGWSGAVAFSLSKTGPGAYELVLTASAAMSVSCERSCGQIDDRHQHG